MSEILTRQEFSELIGFEKECRCDECAHVRSKAVSSHEALRARVVELEAERDNAYGVVSRLATAIWDMEFKPKAPKW